MRRRDPYAGGQQSAKPIQLNFEAEKAELVRLLQIKEQLEEKMRTDIARIGVNSVTSVAAVAYLFKATDFVGSYARVATSGGTSSLAGLSDTIWPSAYAVAAKATSSFGTQLLWPSIEKLIFSKDVSEYIASVPWPGDREEQVSVLNELRQGRQTTEKNIAKIKSIISHKGIDMAVIYNGLVAALFIMWRTIGIDDPEQRKVNTATTAFVVAGSIYELVLNHFLRLDAAHETAEINAKMRNDAISAEQKLNTLLDGLLPGDNQRQLRTERVEFGNGVLGYLKISFLGHKRNAKLSDDLAMKLLVDTLRSYAPEDVRMIYVENQTAYIMLDCFLQRERFKQQIDATFTHLKQNVFNQSWQYAASHFNYLRRHSSEYGLHFLDSTRLDYQGGHFVMTLDINEPVIRRAVMQDLRTAYGERNVAGRYPQLEIHIRDGLTEDLRETHIASLKNSVTNVYKSNDAQSGEAGLSMLFDNDADYSAENTTADQTDDSSGVTSNAMLRFFNRYRSPALVAQAPAQAALTWADKKARNENELVSVKVPGAPANIFYVEWGLEEGNFGAVADNAAWQKSLPRADLRPLVHQGRCFGYKMWDAGKDDRIVLLPIARGEGEHSRKILFQAVAVLDHKDIDALTANGKFGGNTEGNAIPAEQVQAGKQVLDNHIKYVGEHQATGSTSKPRGR